MLTYLFNLSAEAVRNVWISGEHFQRSRLGAGSSLMLAALTSLEGLPLLWEKQSHCVFTSLVAILRLWVYISSRLIRVFHFSLFGKSCDVLVRISMQKDITDSFRSEWILWICQTNSALLVIKSYFKINFYEWNNNLAYMYVSRYSVHCTSTIPSKGECSHTTPQHPSAPITNWNHYSSFILEFIFLVIWSMQFESILFCFFSTCMGLSYQRLPPFLSAPPPWSISKARLVSVSSMPDGSSKHTRHRQRSIMSRESLLVESAPDWEVLHVCEFH